MNRIQLRDDLVIAFNEDELRVLCTRVGLSYDDLAGKTQRDKAGVLIGKLDRLQRLPELVEEVVRERPHLEARYTPYLQQTKAANPSDSSDARLRWLDQFSGTRPPVDEGPTMRWDTDVPDQDAPGD